MQVDGLDCIPLTFKHTSGSVSVELRDTRTTWGGKDLISFSEAGALAAEQWQSKARGKEKGEVQASQSSLEGTF